MRYTKYTSSIIYFKSYHTFSLKKSPNLTM